MICIHKIIGKKNGYLENDCPNFAGSQYSLVKGITDQLISKINNVLNARIRMPISDQIDNRNLITKITKYKKLSRSLIQCQFFQNYYHY